MCEGKKIRSIIFYVSVTEVSLNSMKNKTEIDKNFIRIKIGSD